MLKITYFEFQKWDLDKQTEILTKHGKYIAWREEGEYNIYLYQLEDFFAEAWMNLRQNKIIRIECSNSNSLPGQYGNSVKL